MLIVISFHGQKRMFSYWFLATILILILPGKSAKYFIANPQDLVSVWYHYEEDLKMFDRFNSVLCDMGLYVLVHIYSNFSYYVNSYYLPLNPINTQDNKLLITVNFSELKMLKSNNNRRKFFILMWKNLLGKVCMFFFYRLGNMWIGNKLNIMICYGRRIQK